MTGLAATISLTGVARRRTNAPTLVAHTLVSGISTATTPAINTTGANLLVIVQSQYSQSTIATVSDSNGNTWGFVNPSSNSVAYVRIAYVFGGTVGAGHTFSKTVTGNDYGTMLVMAFANANSFSGGASAANTSAGTSVAAGSVVPSSNNALIVSGLCAADGSSLPFAVSGGLSVTDSAGVISGTQEGGGAAYLVQAIAAAVNPSWSWTGAANAAASTALFGGQTAPAQAVAAGFTNVVFFDDFTSDTVLANSQGASSETAGKNWYWGTATSTANATVNTTATAASISNGNSGGGNWPSTAGGILTLNGVAGNSGNSGLVDSVPQHTPNGVTPSGARQHYYVECYAQFTANGVSSSGWFAFWSWSLAALWGENGGGPAVEHTEIDMAEYYSGGPATMTANTHEWAGNNAHLHQDNFSDGITQDSNWHLYGCLWTGNGTTGSLTFYRDNVSYATVAVGSGTNYPACESSKQYIALSAGQGWPVNIDYVRVWQ